MGLDAGVDLLDRIVDYVIDPAVKVVFTLGLFMFLWGFVEFLWKLKDGQVSEDGKNHMVYGLVGMMIMVSVYGIISLVMNTFGIDPDTATDVSRIQNVNPGVNFFGQ
jgi:uncharacterized RDD family membrane protein YckC